jgi:predicted DNA-binding transcriptional regulator AlpA
MISAIDEAQLVTAQKFCALSCISRAGLHRAMRDDATFPKPLRTIPGSNHSRLRFRLTEVLTWIAERQELTTAARETGRETMSIHLSR